MEAIDEPDRAEMSWIEIQATMERHGVRRISPKGEKFDNNLHRDVRDAPSDTRPVPSSKSSSMVMCCMTVLRPAMAGVSKADSPSTVTRPLITASCKPLETENWCPIWTVKRITRSMTIAAVSKAGRLQDAEDFTSGVGPCAGA